tara:strand:- start:51 stop:275 length:225 start_codon:yes stop_codon:yes gene_type:complete
MVLKLLILGGYGQFVWPAFIFTFASCLIFYLKTKNELRKQEKMFLNEINQEQISSIEGVKRKEITKEALSGTPI